MGKGSEEKRHVAVCGGGLVGALCACYMAKRGYSVDLYEMRPDIRTQTVVKGRSINLALSCRGREALKGVGLEDEILQHAIPMYARMIHDVSGHRRPIPYGRADQCIMSVDRRLLNEVLLSEAEKNKNVRMYFSHKLVHCNFETGEVVFKNELGDSVSSTVDLIIGADGAFSAVRKQMMRLDRFDYQQTYIPHGYMELTIPPTARDEYAIETNYLHIWPRNEYMMIALPNLDKSFTTTLFMPFEMFEDLDSEDKLMKFFREKFPDSIPVLGEEALKRTFLSRTALPMVSVKCDPHHVRDKAVIIGDAAHAIVPFYGQGMNCGLEDCIVLDEMLDKYSNDLGKALLEYSKKRRVDAHAISDLAMYNYIEMRSSVNSRLFLLRKKLDNLLYWLFPKTWVPLYTMVSFTRTRYHECIARRKWQDELLTKTIHSVGLVGGILVAAAIYRAHSTGHSIGGASVARWWQVLQDSAQSWLGR